MKVQTALQSDQSTIIPEMSQQKIYTYPYLYIALAGQIY